MVYVACCWGLHCHCSGNQLGNGLPCVPFHFTYNMYNVKICETGKISVFFFLHPCLHQFPLFFTKTNNLSPRGELIQDSGWVWCQDASRYVEKASLRIGQAEYLLHIGAVHKWRHHFWRVSLQITHVYMCGLNWKPWIFADDIIYEQPLRGALQLEFSETARMLSYPAWPNQPDWIRSNSEHFIFSSKNQLFGFGGLDIRNSSPPPFNR